MKQLKKAQNLKQFHQQAKQISKASKNAGKKAQKS
jgi:hypothetical protein